METRLLEVLEDSVSAAGGGSASVAVLEGSDEPRLAWVPSEEPEEPSFLAYSVTKTFTAVLILCLAEQRQLSLDDRIARWFPQEEMAGEMTLRQLLRHDSGLPDYGGLAAYHEAVREMPGRPWSFDEFLARTREQGALFPPGSGWAYSNPGYMLLTHVLEQASGRSYQELLTEVVCRPLGLARTFLVRTPADMARLAPATSRLLHPEGKPRDVREHYHPGWVSHGVMSSTAGDLARFLHSLFRGELLPAHAVRSMTELVPVRSAGSGEAADDGQGPPNWLEPGYGLGLMGDRAIRGGPFFGHNGGGPGYVASVFHAPDRDSTVAVMAGIEAGFDSQALAFETLSAGPLAQKARQGRGRVDPADS